MKNKLTITPGDDMHMNCLMAPYSLNMVVGEDRQHLLAFGKAAFAAGQKSAAHEALQVGQEPALAQYRMAANWNEPRRWTDWDDCSPEAAADYERIKVLHDWEYQVRRLYAAPQPAPDKDAEIAALKEQMLTGRLSGNLVLVPADQLSNLRGEIAALRRDAERLKFLHTVNQDAEGYEWGVYRVKWVGGRASDVRQTYSDSSDLDAAMTRTVQPAPIKIGDIVEFKGEVFAAVCNGDMPGTFDLHVWPRHRRGDQWKNAPIDQLKLDSNACP